MKRRRHQVKHGVLFARAGKLAASSIALLGSLAWTMDVHAQTTPARLMSNPLQLTVHHMAVSVAHLDEECLWYQRVLGFSELRRYNSGPDKKICQVGIPGFRIDVVAQKGSKRPSARTGPINQGWLHIVFRSPVVELIYGQLQKSGIDVEVDRNAQSTITHIAIHDPEGNEIGIMPD